jgi:flagellar hook-associated protein 2
MGLTPLTFTGVSTYSNDLQTVLTRAVSIASLPLKALQNQDSDILQKKTLLNGMAGSISDLGSAVASLGTLAANNAIAATSSDASKVSVVNNGAGSSAVYSVTDITSVAQAASETTVTGYPDSSSTAVSSNGSMRLVVGSQNYDFTLTNNNLAGLRDQINLLGAGVTASILTTPQGNYLSVSANGTGQTTLKLMDDPTGANLNALTSNNQGANAAFTLNGIPISRSSNVVNDIVGGVTFTILDKTTPSQTVNLTLASDRGQLSSAIQNFAAKYNAVVDQINAQVGPGAGLLSGDFLVRETQNDLRAVANYQTSGTIKSLADVGVHFESNGKISFDSATFSSLSDSALSGAFQFFGSATTGFGSLATKFTQLTDPITGQIKAQTDAYDATDRRLQNNIADMTLRISNFQRATSARLQAADALLAQLQSQQQLLTATIQSMNYSLYGKQPNNQ